MQEDDEGFIYPVVDKSACINCGLCEKVCPVINQNEAREPLNCYAAINPDEQIRLKSSSGGIFTSLAEYIIDNGGVVFGAMWDDNWDVIHSYTENKHDLVLFRGSKYLQSSIGDTYKQAEQFLKAGRKVLFSGTPCQIAGLKKFLVKEYDNLLTVDIICHGVPSRSVFHSYLKEEIKEIIFNHNGKKVSGDLSEKCKIKSINFRDKQKGWKLFSLTICFTYTSLEGKEVSINHSSTLHEDPFMTGFLNNYFLRPSCHECPVRKLKSNADITIGDYWGYDGNLAIEDDDKGISAVIVGSPNGENALKETNMICVTANYSDILRCNSALEKSVKGPYREYFYGHSGKSFRGVISHLTSRKLVDKIRRKIYLKLHKNG